MDQDQFGELAYRVMKCVFELHDELGRLFEESVYRDAIASRMPDARKEVSVEVSFDGFVKKYCLDLLVDGGGLFELKTVEKCTQRLRAQVINYLLLTGLAHAKLINLRSARVQHEFVNTSLSRIERTAFAVDSQRWTAIEALDRELPGWLESAVREWGTGLERRLYEAAVIHFLGGEQRVLGSTEVLLDGQHFKEQPVLWTGPQTIFKMTTLDTESMPAHEEHLLRFIRHLPVAALQWINIGPSILTFKTIRHIH